MQDRVVRLIGEGPQSHMISDLSKRSGGFIGSSVLIAHRPGISDAILYSYFLQRALSNHAVVFFPFAEPFRLPSGVKPVNIEAVEIGTRTRYQKGRIYRFQIQTKSIDDNAADLERFYSKILFSKTRDYPFAIVIDTLRRWPVSLEEHIRFLLREAPLVEGSIWIHCPLSVVPADLLSVFGNVMVIWPSQHEIDLLNAHFPSDQIPARQFEERSSTNSRLLLFKSKPFDQRGWEWRKFSLDS